MHTSWSIGVRNRTGVGCPSYCIFSKNSKAGRKFSPGLAVQMFCNNSPIKVMLQHVINYFKQVILFPLRPQFLPGS